jgi:pilus assembly protein CpaB
MKWSVVILVALGLFAAISASVLVGALRGLPSSAGASSSSSRTEVVLAAKPLVAMSAVGPNDITIKIAPKANLPEGYLSDPVQAIGRVLTVAVTGNQILTQTCFIKDGDPAQLAAAIPYGMRAITVTFPNSSISGGLLYPGCVVDVLASFRLPSKNREKGKAISTTLLQGIQVLAVENSSIITKTKDDKKADADDAVYSDGKKQTITLMVNSRQAEALQLAREYGSISVVMRNPLDKSPVDSDSTVLDEGKLANYGSLLTPTVLTPERKLAILKELGGSKGTPGIGSLGQSAASGEQLEQPLDWWDVTVIRGKDVQTQKLNSPEAEDAPSDDR